VRSVYVYDWGDQPDEMEAAPVGLTSPIRLLIRVSHKTAALDSLLGAYDAALAPRYRALVAPAADRLRTLLLARAVDDQEICCREGYGALITSVRERPIQVWSRQTS
jgi:hypothetical protein